MKTRITFLFIGLLLLAGCSADNDAVSTVPSQSANDANRPSLNHPKQLPAPNKVLLLKVDFLTHNFEGGKALVFEPSNAFTIAHEYQSPGDFGGITLRYAETDQMLFSGTIHWMGLGEMSYPQSLNPAATFPTNMSPVPIPDPALLATVAYDQNAYYPDPMPYGAIWNAIDDLQAVTNFRASNPNSVVNIFLYTPSVGIGNPADWDYFVMLKN